MPVSMDSINIWDVEKKSFWKTLRMRRAFLMVFYPTEPSWHQREKCRFIFSSFHDGWPRGNRRELLFHPYSGIDRRSTDGIGRREGQANPSQKGLWWSKLLRSSFLKVAFNGKWPFLKDQVSECKWPFKHHDGYFHQKNLPWFALRVNYSAGSEKFWIWF